MERLRLSGSIKRVCETKMKKLPKNFGKLKDEMPPLVDFLVKESQKPIQKQVKLSKNMEKDDEDNVSRNVKSLRSFSLYCLDNQNQRFFQALTNWFGVFKIGYFDGKDWNDMWYLEEGDDYQVK